MILSGFEGRDQIVPPAFRAIFPYADHSDVWKLTFDVNHQLTTLQAISVMEEWAPKYWKSKNATTLDSKNRLSNVSFAQDQASDFLMHRSAVRQFLKYMYRTSISTFKFTEKEAIRMREIFWKADLDAKSNYTSARTLFKNDTELAAAHKNFPATFENLTASYYYMHFSSAERLNWTLSR
ncbi:unnamed protein product [Caenorhabditis sp. 36 PRJEB53466]|nr:unnamed protein product [Caenorhabditis sp. 36 PRJEB53466]